tara:strand:- start:606 stop:1085 length:480 start_codon:yes stop_codon:yes gene_type:complete
MQKDFIDYGERINNALLKVIKDILFDLSESKISPNHCFYITFDTTHPNVIISSKLKREYPKEITIVIQNQFWDLDVKDNSFDVTLSFNRKKEMLTIPFESINKFNDPFVKFSLQLEFRSRKTTKVKKIKNVEVKKPKNKKVKISNKIIKLDKFRKNKNE